jgi:hypothetical protein
LEKLPAYPEGWRVLRSDFIVGVSCLIIGGNVAVWGFFTFSSPGGGRLSACGRAVIAEKPIITEFRGGFFTYVSRGADYDLREGNTKSRAGIVRPAAAERRVLGLPKPNPPLERPFPPEFNQIL